MIKIVVWGAKGRMGQEVVQLVKGTRGFQLVGEADGRGPQDPTLQNKEVASVDGVVDFSSPQGALMAARWCSRNGKFLVTGTTGFTSAQMKALKVLARRTPVLWSPNLSPGVAVVRRMMGALAALQDFDFQVEEFHHHHKRDKPSGTALLLQKDLETHLQRRLPEILSIRGGGIRGVHRIWAMGESESICLEHTALDRAVFARGALIAAKWLKGRKAKFYTMDEMVQTWL